MNKQTTFLCGPHGSGKYAAALKLSANQNTAICANWNGEFSEIYQACKPNTQTLIIHGVYLPEHHVNLGLLIHCNSIYCYQNERKFTLERPNIIVCTTAPDIHKDLIINNTVIYNLPIKK